MQIVIAAFAIRDFAESPETQSSLLSSPNSSFGPTLKMFVPFRLSQAWLCSLGESLAAAIGVEPLLSAPNSTVGSNTSKDEHYLRFDLSPFSIPTNMSSENSAILGRWTDYTTGGPQGTHSL